jgi:hypothetical protein
MSVSGRPPSRHCRRPNSRSSGRCPFRRTCVVGVAAGQHVVVGSSENLVDAAASEQVVESGVAEQAVAVRPAGELIVAGTAEQVGGRQDAIGLVESDDVSWSSPNASMRSVLATVGVPPATGTVPPFTKICPATSRPKTMVSATAVPIAVSFLVAGE